MLLKRSIYGLSYEWVQDQVSYLIIRREPDFHKEDFVPLEYYMFTHNEIPGLLKLEFENVNDDIQLRYSIHSSQMVLKVLKAHPISLKDYYVLLERVIVQIGQLNAYCLNEKHVILSPSFVYIGNSIEDVSLTYVPIKHLERNQSTLQEFKTLATELLSYVKELHGNGVQRLFKALSRMEEEGAEVPNWNELKDVLNIQLKSFRDSKRIIETTPITADSQKVKSYRLHKSRSLVPRILKQIKTSVIPLCFMAWLGLLILGISSWLKWINNEENAYLYIASGISVLWLEVSYMLLRSKLSLLSLRQFPGLKMYRRLDRDQHEDDLQSTSQYYANLKNRTTILSQPALTEDLDDEVTSNNHDGQAKLKACLHIKHNGASKTLEIKGERFVIGRGPTEVDLIVDQPLGVSRIQLEIVKREDSFFVQDLGSRNGSKLNGNSMPPYQSYRLQHKDVIQVLQNEFVFELI